MWLKHFSGVVIETQPVVITSRCKVAPLFDSAAVIGVKGRTPDKGLSLSNPCISSQQHSFCPVTSQGTGLSPNSQAISVRNGHGSCAAHLRTRGCTSRVERADVVVNTASCLFSLFPFLRSLSCPSCEKGGDRSAIHAPPLTPTLNLPCRSVSLYPSVPGAAQTTVLLCWLSKSLFYPFAPAIFLQSFRTRCT